MSMQKKATEFIVQVKVKTDIPVTRSTVRNWMVDAVDYGRKTVTGLKPDGVIESAVVLRDVHTE